MRFLAPFVALGVVNANMYDVVDPNLVPPSICGSAGCANWSTLNSTIQAWWSSGSTPDDAGALCAQLANAPALAHPSPVLDPSGVGGQGEWCVCANNTEAWGYCTSPDQIPEQINLQMASPDTVVVSFVTFESTEPSEAPYASIQQANTTTNDDVKRGVTHVYYTPKKDRTYYFHFVVFDGLSASTQYEYSVKSGGENAPWSKSFVFTSPPPRSGPTSVAIFGDMGVYSWNCKSLYKTCMCCSSFSFSSSSYCYCFG